MNQRSMLLAGLGAGAVLLLANRRGRGLSGRGDLLDPALVERVRAKLADLLPDARDLEVSSWLGRITLAGTLSPALANAVLGAVGAVRGVRGVVDHMDRRDAVTSGFATSAAPSYARRPPRRRSAGVFAAAGAALAIYGIGRALRSKNGEPAKHAEFEGAPTD